MLQVKRAGHSTLTTPDIGRTVDYFTRIVGLNLVAREKDRAILATKSGLEAIALERHDITPGIREALAFKDPKGTTLEILPDCSFTADDDTFTGVMPLKLGHIAYTCSDVAGMVKFYCDVLGFRVSDWRSDFFAFLRCSRDHHTVNFLRDAKTAIHHIAFEVRDWSDIKRASDLLAKNKITLTWGPLRHIIGHNIAIYHRNPDGVVIEFFCEMDQMYDEELGYFEPRPCHQDRPQRPKVWATIRRPIGGARCRTVQTARIPRKRRDRQSVKNRHSPVLIAPSGRAAAMRPEQARDRAAPGSRRDGTSSRRRRHNSVRYDPVRRRHENRSGDDRLGGNRLRN